MVERQKIISGSLFSFIWTLTGIFGFYLTYILYKYNNNAYFVKRNIPLIICLLLILYPHFYVLLLIQLIGPGFEYFRIPVYLQLYIKYEYK